MIHLGVCGLWGGNIKQLLANGVRRGKARYKVGYVVNGLPKTCGLLWGYDN